MKIAFIHCENMKMNGAPRTMPATATTTMALNRKATLGGASAVLHWQPDILHCTCIKYNSLMAASRR